MILHSRRLQADFDGWGLHVWGDTNEEVTWQDPLPPTGQTEHGMFWVVRILYGATELNYIVHKGDEKDPGPDQIFIFSEMRCKIWLVEGQETKFGDPGSGILALTTSMSESPIPGENQVLLHYRRAKADYPGWGLHLRILLLYSNS